MTTTVYSTPLLLRGNGVDGSTSLTDDTGKAVTCYGNAAVSTFYSMPPDTSSLVFDGSGDYMSIPYTADLALNRDFMIDALVSIAALPALGVYCTIASHAWSLGTYAWYFGVGRDAGGISLNYTSYTPAGVATVATTTWTGAAIDQWTHFAVAADNFGIRVAINGVFGSPSGSWGIRPRSPSTPIFIGTADPLVNPAYMNGRIAALRIVTGSPIYRENFIPPIALTALSGTYDVPVRPDYNNVLTYGLGDPGQFLVSPRFISTGKLGSTNLHYGGSGRISGTVKVIPAFPVRRKVMLFREDTMTLINTAWSDAITGAYNFDFIDRTRKYTVMAYDYTGAYRSVISNGVVPKLIA